MNVLMFCCPLSSLRCWNIPWSKKTASQSDGHMDLLIPEIFVCPSLFVWGTHTVSEEPFSSSASRVACVLLKGWGSAALQFEHAMHTPSVLTKCEKTGDQCSVVAGTCQCKWCCRSLTQRVHDKGNGNWFASWEFCVLSRASANSAGYLVCLNLTRLNYCTSHFIQFQKEAASSFNKGQTGMLRTGTALVTQVRGTNTHYMLETHSTALIYCCYQGQTPHTVCQAVGCQRLSWTERR